MNHPHASAAAARRRFEHHGISDALRDVESLFRVLKNSVRAGQDRHAAFGHRGARMLFQTHSARDVRFRADKLDFGRLAHFGEIGVLAQETVARMNGIDVGDLGRADHRRNVEIAARALCGTNANGFIGESHVQAVAIGLRVNGHGFDAKILAGANDANGDFASIGDQNFLEHITAD